MTIYILHKKHNGDHVKTYSMIDISTKCTYRDIYFINIDNV